MSIKEQITLDEAIKFIDSLAEIDPGGLSRLLLTRVPCNAAMADHPTLQVQVIDEGKGEFSIGLLGLLNGLFGKFDSGPMEGWGPIVIECTRDGAMQVIRCRRTNPEGEIEG